MRAFLTGATGFVGSWLIRHLEAEGDDVAALSDGTDVTDTAAVAREVAQARPDAVYHLAALTHVGRSWEAPEETFRVNATGTLSLLEAVRLLDHPPRVLLVSSAEVYGPPLGGPVTEESPLRPVTPYAASKVAAEYLGLQAHLGRGIEVIRARPFNHVGPGQAEAFVVSALAKRLVEAEGSGSDEVSVGDLSPARDFTDVRDVVRAYRLLVEEGTPGDVYNVCSGQAVPIALVFDQLVGLVRSPVRPVVDPDLLRPVDVPTLVGDPSKIESLTGWKPEIPLGQTLADVVIDWRARLELAPGPMAS
ncbi:MAG TPA: GDP-mannose 4,6-dehydratase [Acidimicrobiales bacterium]|nr:GDP-mannose 4,6-dehydratase [Acidimicrobiales bacterium]